MPSRLEATRRAAALQYSVPWRLEIPKVARHVDVWTRRMRVAAMRAPALAPRRFADQTHAFQAASRPPMVREPRKRLDRQLLGAQFDQQRLHAMDSLVPLGCGVKKGA